MGIHSIKQQAHYLVTGVCALLSLFSCIFLPFVTVSNEGVISSHPLVFTGMDLAGSNWLNLILSIGMLVVVANFTLLKNPFGSKEIPLATQEYWANRSLMIISLLGLLINIWAFFNVKQTFSAYSQVDNIYSTKLMMGGWLILICMTAIVVSNILNRQPAPQKKSSEAALTSVNVERRNTPQDPAGHAPQQQNQANYAWPQTPAASYNVAPPMPAGQPIPALANQPPAQQRPINPAAPMQVNQPAPQQRPMNPAASMPVNPPAPQQQRPVNPAAPMQVNQPVSQRQRPINPAPMPMQQPAPQQRPANPAVPMPMNQPVPQQRPMNPPASGPANPYAPQQQRPVNPAPMPMQQPRPQQQPANPSPLQQRPFSLPALPQTPPIQPAVQQKPVNPPPAVPQPALPSVQPAAQQKPPNTPVFPLPGGKSTLQQRPFSLPGLPQTPPIQPAVQQKPANPPAAPQPDGRSMVQQRPFSLPALPKAAQANPVTADAPQQAQPGSAPEVPQNNPRSQFVKPPSQA
jgi:hypothetical protein